MFNEITMNIAIICILLILIPIALGVSGMFVYAVWIYLKDYLIKRRNK